MAIERQRIYCLMTWAMRILVGGVFLFSGFVKAVDPWGSLYKIDSYLAALGIDLWPNLKLVGAFALGGTEFMLGLFIILGCFRRAASIIIAIMMAFMLPLTLWVALKNPVDDCGCFGDALVISNWATFWKNVILSAAAVWLIKFNRPTHWLITPALQWIAFIVAAVYILTIELMGYISQPLLDFRPYPVGESLIAADYDIEQSEPHYLFEYEKDSVVKSFTEDDALPDEADGWVFVGRKEIPNDEHVGTGKATDEKALRIWSEDGEDDMTEEVVSSSRNQLLIMMPDLAEVSPSITWKINSLFEWSRQNDVDMAAIVSGTPEEIERWKDISMAGYPTYTAEDTQIKEVVRGNPGVVYISDGIIKWKRALNAIYVDDFMLPGTSHDAMAFAFDNERMLRNCTYILLSVLAMLVFLSFSPIIKDIFFRTGKIMRAGFAGKAVVNKNDTGMAGEGKREENKNENCNREDVTRENGQS